MTATERTKRIPLQKALGIFFDPKPHLSTAIRWCHLGVIAPNGERVRLRSERIGNRRYVFETDVEAFIRALNPEPDLPQDRSDNGVIRGTDASRTLESLGY